MSTAPHRPAAPVNTRHADLRSADGVPLVFATVDHRSQASRVFGIRPADLLRHVYIIGKTGSGKSVLLENLAVGQIERGHGVGVIDPHGDLAERVLAAMPRRRKSDVVYVDPADPLSTAAINLLEHRPDDNRALLASGVLAVFRKVFSEFWGPRLEHVFRNCILALLETRSPTLMGVLRMLVEERYRESVVRLVTDPVVRFFWTEEFPRYPASFVAEMVSPVQNKVAAVLTDATLRRILDRPRSTFSCAKIVDRGGILIANLSKGRLGDTASALLGAILVSKFQQAAYARASVPTETRRPFTLYVDEFPGFVTQSFGELMAEARKYGLGLVLAHQHLGQIDDGLRRAVLGNAGTIIAFQLGAEDADVLGREFKPELSEHDLARLAQHQIAIRLCVDGVTSVPFTARALPPRPPAQASRHPVRSASSGNDSGRHARA